MVVFNLKYFGSLDINLLKEFYSVDILFNGMNLELDLNFEEQKIEKQKLFPVQNMIENLNELISMSRKALENDFKNEGEVKDYIENHLEELEEEDIIKIIKGTDSTLSRENRILAFLNLKRIGFYPEDEDEFAVFDFTIDSNLTDYIIAVKINSIGQIEEVSMES